MDTTLRPGDKPSTDPREATTPASGTRRRVVIVDDHPVFRIGLMELLADEEAYEVVGEAGGEDEALATIARQSPDIVIADLGLSQGDGFSLIRRARAASPATCFVVTSGYSSLDHIARALRAGATAFVVKDSGILEMRRALDAVARGETYLSPRASARFVDGILGRPTPGNELASLTDRQREILRLLAHGHASKEIATRLGLSAKTVDAHRTHIMERLNIRGTHNLLRFAFQAGLSEP